MSDGERRSRVTRRRLVTDGIAVTVGAGLLGTGPATAEERVGVETDVSPRTVDGLTTQDSLSTTSSTKTAGYYVESTDALGNTNWKWYNYTSWEYTGDELLWANSVGENGQANKLWSFVGQYYEDLAYKENSDGTRVAATTTQVGEYDHPTDHAYPWVQVYVNGNGEHGLDDYGANWPDDTT